MRVIGGEFRSRRLESVPGMDVRPTPDRLREALFNVLAPVIAGSVFVDAYAGSGSVGIEALSRGAERAVFLEKNRAAAAVIRANLAALGIADRARLVVGKVETSLAVYAPDAIVFLDPPYPMTKQYETALSLLSGARPVLAAVQHATRFALPDRYGALARYRILRQGDNSLSFFRSSPIEPATCPPSSSE